MGNVSKIGRLQAQDGNGKQKACHVDISDTALRRQIKKDLPQEAFRRKPHRAFLLIPILTVILGGSFIIGMHIVRWPTAAVCALIVGNAYASLLFLAHEIAHGATVRSRRLQDGFLYLALWIFCISPNLFRYWHNRAHHNHTNIPQKDPDCVGLIQSYGRRGLLLTHVLPGAGHLMGAIFMLVGFSLQGHSVLWKHSRRHTSFDRMNRSRAILETILMLTSWIALSIFLGPTRSAFIIVVPMILANTVAMSYICTNHYLRPLTARSNTLSTTMSVRTAKFLDVIHFNFSHHVEHHLFPSMSSAHYPKVRQWLVDHMADIYLTPPHWKALLMVFRTPRVHLDQTTLTSPDMRIQVAITEIEMRLRKGKPPTTEICLAGQRRDGSD